LFAASGADAGGGFGQCRVGSHREIFGLGEGERLGIAGGFFGLREGLGDELRNVCLRREERPRLCGRGILRVGSR
jgi:hypothetical protein